MVFASCLLSIISIKLKIKFHLHDYDFLYLLYLLGQNDWVGPFSNVWNQSYIATCDTEEEFQNTTVEECKKICKNQHGCNVIVFRNKIKKSEPTSCKVRKCPVPIPPPKRVLNPGNIESFYFQMNWQITKNVC